MNTDHVDQINRDIPFYISGFSDKEGSFNVSFRKSENQKIRKRDHFLIGWKMSPRRDI